MNLLIVDDEYYIVQGIKSTIRCDVLGIDSVFVAYSCDQARQIIKKEPIDIMITDIEMSRENGLSLINWLQEQNYTILTLILSGHQRFDYAQEAIKMHCFSYILKPVTPALLEKELFKAIKSLNQSSTVVPTADPNASNESNDDEFIRKVRSYIREHLDSCDLTRNSIASHIHMNPDYLSSLFHTKFHQTLSTYITTARIDKAKELLLHSSLSLNEISEKAGFTSSSYFHRQFKKYTGLTPQQFRRVRGESQGDRYCDSN